MNYSLSGKLHRKFDTVTVSDKFRKREFVLEISDGSPYTQYISLQLTQDKCALIDAHQPGANLTVEFNLRGREWKSPQGEIKYFNTLEAWRVQGAAQQPADAGRDRYENPPPVAPVDAISLGDEDDLPF
ncbi:MAG: DUF3127 domain-containing protein [Bacteroidia bacterium]|jgi:hypothetical protein|nr:DUF3127 domain-containing protein [Bacteroidia bacterium]